MSDHPQASHANYLGWQLHDYYDRLKREALSALPQPRTPEEWAELKPQLRDSLAKALGYVPHLLPTVDAERLGATQREGYTVARIVLHGWPDAPISANLYVPDDLNGPAPAIAAPHGHSMDGKAYEVYQHCHINLARRGYVVLAWDMIGYGERQAMGHRFGRWPMLVGLSLKGLLVTEAQALVTWLTEQPEVDATRIGCTGNSGGGAQTLMLAALDTRIAAAAPAGHTSPLTFIADKEKNLCSCTLLPGFLRYAEVEHIFGLIAPRPAMIVAGRNDCLFPDDLARRSHRLGHRFYALEGVRDRLELSVSECGHGYEQPKREAMYAFFDRALKGEDVQQVEESPTEPEPPDSPALKCWPDSPPAFCTVRDLALYLADRLPTPAHAPKRLWQDVLGIKKLPFVTEVTPSTSDGDWDAMRLTLDNGIVLPILVSRSEHSAAPATIIVDDLGKASERANECARTKQQAGETVILADLLGWGETAPHELKERGDDETFAAQRGVFLGRPLLGERAADLVAVTQWAAQLLRPQAITVEAFGWAALVALLAATGERSEPASPPTQVRSHAMPIQSLWDDCGEDRPLFTFPHGILGVSDLSGLLTLTAEH